MLHHTRGIVLRTTPYSDTSVVAQIFTEKFGIQAYLINGVKRAKSKIPANILQPLHLLEMVVYYKQNTQLQRVAEARALPVFSSIPYHLLKNTIAQFLNEVLYKSIRAQQADPALFEFLFSAIAWFDEFDGEVVNFHLIFLMKLSRFLGFSPREMENSSQKYFDLQAGHFTSVMPEHPYFVDNQDGLLLLQLFNVRFADTDSLKFSNTQRRQLLDKILIFY
jgi:DNA repair protein RecO (recombination protein O)